MINDDMAKFTCSFSVTSVMALRLSDLLSRLIVLSIDQVSVS